MTDKFTPEQIERIEAAVGAALCDPQKTMPLYEYIIAELTRPQWEPQQVGEVYVDGDGKIGWHNALGLIIEKTHENGPRALTPAEVPAWQACIEREQLAIELLRELKSRIGSTWVQEEIDTIWAKLKVLTPDG